MPAIGSRWTPEELARLGAEILERQVGPRLTPGDKDKFVAIDVDSDDFEIDEDDFTAVSGLRARRPAGDLWLGRVGQPAAYRGGIRINTPRLTHRS